ncbi:bidirectional sugar transporter SWEET3b-like [Magnolia sinica]|uniref:bidirectional sugar transporter SWEET3b-like n=1 Tax=Magnolia sinica TaxID=86752 RepID=UPI00265A70A1|nr:bidirectional sugar transporter SWEET3b-like [Magnolia sinica]
MTDKLRLAIGVMGNAASLLLYAAPILTFKRVIRKGSTEEFSCVPYIIALCNCLLYTWYGLPIVSVGWENFPIISINGIGILLEISFIFIYFWFTSIRGKKLVSLAVALVAIVFSAIVLVSTFALHDHRHRKMLVGCFGLVASVSMYGSPLVAVRQVIVTKSVEYMPFNLSLFSFLASTLWMIYGLLQHDLFLASPSLLGSPLGILQLVLYCIYRKNKKTPEKLDKLEMEKKGVDFKPLPEKQDPEKLDLEKNGVGYESHPPKINGLK